MIGSHDVQNDCYIFYPVSIAGVDPTGRQLITGLRPMAGTGDNGILQVERKVFVPQNGGFARYLEILSNPLSLPVTTTVEIDNEFTDNLNGTFANLIVDPSTNNNTYAVVGLPGIGTVGFAYGGSKTALTASSGLGLLNDNTFTLRWTVTIPANQTVILMHFLIQQSSANSASATSQAQALVNLTDPNALVGMTAQEQAEVLNFP